jgi:hypothetical protein
MYEWDETDSYFTSSNDILNEVWELNRYTVQAGLLDTFTDSNTRERKPYEADGLVAGTSRVWLQRDLMWLRHSISYVIQYPTWPVEWVQISVLLAYLDYYNTGQPDLAGAYMDLLSNNTRLMDADDTGLLNCQGTRMCASLLFHLFKFNLLFLSSPVLSAPTTSSLSPHTPHTRTAAQAKNGCNGRPGKGHHIIDWDPPPGGSLFRGSNHTSVNNGFCIRGLYALSELAGLLGKKADADDFKAKADKLYRHVEGENVA